MATTLTQMQTLIRERADMESTTFVTDSMLTSWVNMASEALYDRVVAAFQNHFFTTADFTLTGGTVANSQYTLAAGIRLMRWLERYPDTTNRQPVKAWTFGEKDAVNEVRYRLLGSVLQIEPYEYSAGAYRIYYVPNPTALSAGSDALDAKLDSWREYIVLECAIKARTREESDVTDLRVDLERVIARIDLMANVRDSGNPPRMNDVSEEATSSGWPWYR